MFYDFINKAIEECTSELLNSSDSQIQESLAILEKTFSKVQFDLIIENIVRTNVSRMIMDEPAPEVSDKAIRLSLQEMEKVADVMCRSVLLNIQTNHNSYRKIEMPYYCTLGDLAYMILDIFDQDPGHYYRIQFPKSHTKWNPTEAPNINLPEILVHGDEEMTMDHDDIKYKIQSIEILEYDHIFNFNMAKILEGNNEDPSTFDLKELNQTLLKKFHEIRNVYEH